MNMREHLEELINLDEPIDYREIAREFGSSYPAVKNLEYIIRTGKPYYKKTKGMAIASINNNRARRLGVHGTISRDEWLRVCKEHNNRCAHCKESLPLTMDHIIPLSRGGTHTVNNIQPLCQTCNSRKGNRPNARYAAAAKRNASLPPRPGSKPRGRPRKTPASE